MLGNSSTTYLVALIVTLLISLPIHETMHGLAAYWLGDKTAADQGRLSLNPIKHIDPFMTLIMPIVTFVLSGIPILATKPVPFNPDRVKYDEFGVAIIAAAGPFSNLILAIIGSLIYNSIGTSSSLSLFFQAFASLNVILFIFNLIPIPPLDGSRILYAFSPEGLQDILRQIEPYGFFILITFVLALRNPLNNFFTSVLNLFHLPIN